jgi:hypothetical protein
VSDDVDIDSVAYGILHAMIMGALDTGFTEIAEWPMPPVGPLNKVEHISGIHADPNFVIGISTFNPTTDPQNLFVTLERRAPRDLSPQDRYEVLERLLDLLAVEVAKAKQDAYA